MLPYILDFPTAQHCHLNTRHILLLLLLFNFDSPISDLFKYHNWYTYIVNTNFYSVILMHMNYEHNYEYKYSIFSPYLYEYLIVLFVNMFNYCSITTSLMSWCIITYYIQGVQNFHYVATSPSQALGCYLLYRNFPVTVHSHCIESF